MLWFMIFLSMFFSSLIMIISNLLSEKLDYNLHKMSPFECGFLSFSTLRFSFSISFFLIALIFLIFDIEIIFVFPFLMLQSFNLFSFMSFSLLMFFIFYGLIHEWYIGSLNWLN